MTFAWPLTSWMYYTLFKDSFDQIWLSFDLHTYTSVAFVDIRWLFCKSAIFRSVLFYNIIVTFGVECLFTSWYLWKEDTYNNTFVPNRFILGFTFQARMYPSSPWCDRQRLRRTKVTSKPGPITRQMLRNLQYFNSGCMLLWHLYL